MNTPIKLNVCKLSLLLSLLSRNHGYMSLTTKKYIAEDMYKVLLPTCLTQLASLNFESWKVAMRMAWYRFLGFNIPALVL